jgi:hypothetical protein
MVGLRSALDKLRLRRDGFQDIPARDGSSGRDGSPVPPMPFALGWDGPTV